MDMFCNLLGFRSYQNDLEAKIQSDEPKEPNPALENTRDQENMDNQKKFFDAIENANLQTVEVMLNEDNRLKDCSYEKEPAIFAAISNYKVEDVIKDGAAIRRSAVDILLSKGVDMEKVDERNEPPLFRAIQKGGIELVKKIIDACPKVINKQYRREKTALMHAINKENLDAVVLLVRHNDANLNIKDVDGRHALFYAMYQDHPEIMVAVASAVGRIDYYLSDKNKMQAVDVNLPDSRRARPILKTCIDYYNKNPEVIKKVKRGEIDARMETEYINNLGDYLQENMNIKKRGHAEIVYRGQQIYLYGDVQRFDMSKDTVKYTKRNQDKGDVQNESNTFIIPVYQKDDHFIAGEVDHVTLKYRSDSQNDLTQEAEGCGSNQQVQNSRQGQETSDDSMSTMGSHDPIRNVMNGWEENQRSRKAQETSDDSIISREKDFTAIDLDVDLDC